MDYMKIKGKCLYNINLCLYGTVSFTYNFLIDLKYFSKNQRMRQFLPVAEQVSDPPASGTATTQWILFFQDPLCCPTLPTSTSSPWPAHSHNSSRHHRPTSVRRTAAPPLGSIFRSTTLAEDFIFTGGQVGFRHPRPHKHQQRHSTGTEDLPVTRILGPQARRQEKKTENKHSSNKDKCKNQHLNL